MQIGPHGDFTERLAGLLPAEASRALSAALLAWSREEAVLAQVLDWLQFMVLLVTKLRRGPTAVGTNLELTGQDDVR